MGILSNIFGKEERSLDGPDIVFGRYSDSHKSHANYNAWDKSMEYFEEERYFDSFYEFLIYLSDEAESNVTIDKKEGELTFKLYQGSKRINGKFDGKTISAWTKVASIINSNVVVFRKVMDQNYNLKYSRYAIDDDGDMVVLFDTSVKDSSPYKLYYALKELATTADKNDDLLLDEFENSLKGIDNKHIVDLSLEEKEVKHSYLKEETQKVLEIMVEQKEFFDKFPGAAVYILLDLVFRLDYLIRPEGYMMEKLEYIHRTYFASDKKPLTDKYTFIIDELTRLNNRSRKSLFKELYRTRNTFGIVAPISHNRVVGIIDNEIGNIHWYKDHKYLTVAKAIPGYIIGYCLFNYSVPKPDKMLFQLYYEVTNHAYFKKLGFEKTLIREDGKLDKKAILKRIQQCRSANKSVYPFFKPNTSLLVFNNMQAFSESFLHMIKQLDLTPNRDVS